MIGYMAESEQTRQGADSREGVQEVLDDLKGQEVRKVREGREV